jgi:hypothetical protein
MNKILAIALFLSLLLPSVSAAQGSNADWSLLQSISSGQTVVAKTVSGKSLNGFFLRATASALELNVDGKRVELKSAEVSRVYVQRGRPILKWTLIGTAVGTGSGAGLGAYEGRNDHWFGPGFDTAIGAGIGLIAGSITGLAIGASHHKNELVYKAVK